MGIDIGHSGHIGNWIIIGGLATTNFFTSTRLEDEKVHGFGSLISNCFADRACPRWTSDRRWDFRSTHSRKSALDHTFNRHSAGYTVPSYFIFFSFHLVTHHRTTAKYFFIYKKRAWVNLIGANRKGYPLQTKNRNQYYITYIHGVAPRTCINGTFITRAGLHSRRTDPTYLYVMGRIGRVRN